jgi:hypothetical protein
MLRRPGAAPLGEDTQDLADLRFEFEYDDHTLTDAWPGGFMPAGDTGPPPPAERGWVRVSAWATFGLISSLVGLCATLTGLLAPEGLILGAIGLVASVAGLIGASRTGVTGHSLAILGLLSGLAATGLALAAITGHLRWLDSHTDAVPRWHAWLVAHWPLLGRPTKG